jgi:PAS domain S-box-containing protein
MADRIRQMGSVGSPLGPLDTWPTGLRSAIDLMLPADAQMVVFWGPQFITFYNDAYAPTIGDKHPLALGNQAVNVWPELWDDLFPLLMGVWTTGKTFAAKDRPFKIDRHGYVEEVFFDVSYSPLRSEQGDIVGLTCIVRETTNTVLATRALEASEARLRFEQSFTSLLLDASSEGIYAIDQDGVTTLCNATFLKLLGFTSSSEVVGLKLHDLIHHSHADGSDYPERLCPILAAAQLGQPASVTGDVFFRKDGSALPVDYRAEPVWRNGVLQGAVCIFVDTSERAAGKLLAVGKEQAELALRESSDQLRLAQVAGGVGLFLVDIHQNTITGSREFFRLFGLPDAANYPVAELDKLFVAPLSVASSTGPSLPSTRESRLRGDAPLETEYCIRQADTGRVRWLARRAEFVHDDEGKPIFMRGVVQDITERKAAEAAVKATEARFRALVQTLPNQVWIADSSGQLTWFNQVVCDYTGLPAAAMTGEAWTCNVHPDDLPEVTKVWTHCLNTLTPYHVEFRVRRHDGVYRWHLVRGVAVETDTGVQWVGANTDIDDQRMVQDGLSAMNLRLEKQVDDRTRELDRMWRLSTDLILQGDTTGTIHAVNPAWEQLLGWPLRELVGGDFMRLVHPDDLDRTRAELTQLAQGFITRRFENRVLRRDGLYCSVCWTAVPENGVIHAVGRDMTAEQESAEALQQAEDRLRQSQKMEALGQLTGGIAHDFNNLLQGISGSIDIVRGRLADGRSDDVGRFMDAATQSAHRAASLIQRLLAFARRQSLNSHTVNVNQLVVSMEDLLGRTLGPQIKLKVTTGQGVWMARSDENQLESAILNLAINARDAMPDGGTLTLETLNSTLDAAYVRAHEGLQAGDYAVVAVTDTGTGMSPAVLAKVFEPFFTTKPIGQGTGLGLSGIYGFAKQSGGHVRIHSREGQGTTVRLFLPRDNATAEVVAPVPVLEIPQGEGETVMVVEDDAAVRMIVLDELGELGYQTLHAIDGPTALPILQSSRKIDLLLTDVGLPGMNGRQIAEIARQHRPDLPVLFMTGYAEKAASRSKFLAPGMEMISKPFTMDALAARIGAILREPANPPAASDTDADADNNNDKNLNNKTEGA